MRVASPNSTTITFHPTKHHSQLSAQPIYPEQLTHTSQQLSQVQTHLQKITQQINHHRQQFPLQNLLNLPKFSTTPKNPHNYQSSQNLKKILQKQWLYQQQIQLKNNEQLHKCIQFYQLKLHQQQLKYQHLQKQNHTKLQSKFRQNQFLLAQPPPLKNQLHLIAHPSNSNLSTTTDHPDNQSYRSSQQQRINQMLIKQKLAIYNQFNKIQQDNLAILQFVQQISQILEKQTPIDEHEDVKQMTYIQQIQVQASKFYAILTHTLSQQIINQLALIINLLYKKLSSTQNTTSLPPPANTNIQLIFLKDQLSRMSKTYQKIIQQHKYQLMKTTYKINQMSTNITNLQNNIKHYQQKINQYQKQINHLNTLLSSQQISYQIKFNQLKQQKQIVTLQLTNQLSIKTQQMNTHLQLIQQLQKNIQHLQQNHPSLNQQLTQYNHILKEKQQLINNLQQYLAQINQLLKNKSQQLQTTHSQTNKKLKDFQALQKMYQIQLKDTQIKLQTNYQITKLQQLSCKQLSNQNNQLKNLLKLNQNNINQLQKKLKNMQETHNKNQSQLSKMQQQLNEVNEKMRNMEQATKIQTQKQFQIYQNQHQNKLKQINMLLQQKQHQKLISEQNAQKQNQSKNQISQLQHQLKESHTTSNNKDHQLMSQLINKLNNQLEEKQTKQSALHKQILKLNTLLIQKQKYIQQTQNIYKTTIHDLTNQHTTCLHLMQQNTTINNKIIQFTQLLSIKQQQIQQLNKIINQHMNNKSKFTYSDSQDNYLLFPKSILSNNPKSIKQNVKTQLNNQIKQINIKNKEEEQQNCLHLQSRSQGYNSKGDKQQKQDHMDVKSSPPKQKYKQQSQQQSQSQQQQHKSQSKQLPIHLIPPKQHPIQHIHLTTQPLSQPNQKQHYQQQIQKLNVIIIQLQNQLQKHKKQKQINNKQLQQQIKKDNQYQNQQFLSFEADFQQQKNPSHHQYSNNFKNCKLQRRITAPLIQNTQLSPQNNQKPINEKYSNSPKNKHKKQKPPSTPNQQSHQHHIPLSPINNQDTYYHNHSQNIQQTIKFLSQQNKYLKNHNQKLIKDLHHFSHLFHYLSKKFTTFHLNQNNKEVIPISQIQQQIQSLQSNNLKLLPQFQNTTLSQLQTNLTQIITQIKKWLYSIQSFIKQNRKLTLEIMLTHNHPKLIKKSKHQPNDYKTSYSQGTSKKTHLPIDHISFQHQQPYYNHMHPIKQHEHILHNENQLNAIFTQNNEISDISSVKHNQQNSQFINQNSEHNYYIFNKQHQKQDHHLTLSKIHHQLKLYHKFQHHYPTTCQYCQHLYYNQICYFKCFKSQIYQEFACFMNKVICNSNQLQLNKTIKEQSIITQSFIKNPQNQLKNNHYKLTIPKISQQKNDKKTLQNQNKNNNNIENTQTNNAKNKKTEIPQQKNTKNQNNQNSIQQKSNQKKQQPQITRPKKKQDSSNRFSQKLSQQPSQKKQTRQRTSDQGQKLVSGSSLNIGDILTNLLSINTSFNRKKSLSEAVQKQKIVSNQTKLKQINKKILQILQTQQISPSPQQPTLQPPDPQKQQEKNPLKKKQSLQQKQQSQKYQQQILKNLSLLQLDLLTIKQQNIKRSNQKQQKFKQVIKDIIFNFKISKKSIEKIIYQKQRKSNNSVKYLNVRAFFKSLYQRFTKKDSFKSQNTDLSPQLPSLQLDSTKQLQNHSQDLLRQFQSFQDKQTQLIKQNTKLKKQLQNKATQITSLKKQYQHYINHHQSNSLSGKPDHDDKFVDFQKRQIYDNTKPSLQLIQQMNKQKQFYINKCKELQQQLKKKNNQHIKYIRKW